MAQFHPRGLALACLALLITLASAGQYTGNFKRLDLKNNGVMNGRFQYDWNSNAMRYSYTSNGYQELYSYNPTRGASGDYTKQYVYQSATSGICGQCQTSPLKAPMPQLFVAAPTGFTQSGTETINGQSCQVWRASSTNQDADQPSHIYINPSNSYPCAIRYVDGRYLVFDSITTTSGVSFVIPSGCQCQKRLDIHLLLDASGSIDNNEWNQINTWVRNLASSFTYGTNAGAMSITTFASSSKVVMPLTDVKSKIDQTLRSNLPKAGGGTNVISGINLIMNSIWPNRRQNAIPILITLTDGADSSSATTIANRINQLKVAPYNMKFVSIFIGSGTSTRQQMIALAGGDASRTYQYNDFAAFSKAVNEIVAAACDSDVKDMDCGSACCGMCMCTTCVTPDACDDGLACTDQSLVATGTAGLRCCSAPVQRSCAAKDKCHTAACDPATGQCKDTPINCNTGNLCDAISCDPALGCQAGPKCTSDDKCQIPSCNPSNGQCSFSPKQCPPNDACHTYTCQSPGGDCVVTLKDCDDGDPCTADSCDNTLGCQHVRQDCDCTCPEPSTVCEAKDCKQGLCITTSKCLESPDPCYNYTGNCDLVNGCEKVPVCRDDDPCTEDICNDGVCEFRPIECDDGNACTDDQCVEGVCEFTPIECPDMDKCHIGSCNSSIGCVQTPIDLSLCDDFNVCTNDTCDPDVGCVNTPGALDCDDGRPCTDDACDPQIGCVSTLKVCPDKPRCSIGTCENGTCTLYKPPLCKEDIIAIGLSAGAIVGIVIGIVVCMAITGFAAFKGYQAYNAGKDLDSVGQQNPLYEQGGQYGENKLYGDYDAFQK